MKILYGPARLLEKARKAPSGLNTGRMSLASERMGTCGVPEPVALATAMSLLSGDVACAAANTICDPSTDQRGADSMYVVRSVVIGVMLVGLFTSITTTSGPACALLKSSRTTATREQSGEKAGWL